MKESAERTVVYTDYHSGGRVPYPAVLRDPETDEVVDKRGLIRELAREAGIEDGDAFVISVQPTGERPFGDRKVVLAEPNTYRREDADASGRDQEDDNG